MKVVFIVGSEEELSCGVQWLDRVVREQNATLHLVVLGTQRKALGELARRRFSERVDGSDQKIQVAHFESSPGPILKYARSNGCDTLLIFYREDAEKFQRELFEESRLPSFWLRVVGFPPASTDKIRLLFRRPGRVASSACEKLFAPLPSYAMVEKIDSKEDDLNAIARSAIESSGVNPESGLVIVDVEHVRPDNRAYRSGLTLLAQPPDVSMALVHPGDTFMEAMAAKVRHWADAVAPPLEREERIELARDLQSGSEPNLEFLGLMSAASMLASFGLLQNSASVIIGAMLIAPLMTPILGAGLALTQGNRPLFQSAVKTIVLGFLGALMSSMAFGWLYLLFHSPTASDEMWARCQPSPLDFCVGLVGGIAASYARTRKHLSSALAGAAIAAALVPPIATAGLQLAFWHWDTSSKGTPILGPLLLVSVNVLTIMIGSSFVLWTRGMRTDRNIPVKDRWVLRMLAMLTVLVLLIVIWTLYPLPRN